MNQYTFLSLTEPPDARRARHIRFGLVFCLALGISIAFGLVWRRYNPDESKGLYQDWINPAIAAGISVLLSEKGKAQTEKLRREFKLTIDSEIVSRERPPLKLSRREIEAVYIGPFHSLRIASTDRRRLIIVPGELEQKESVLRDLLGMGLPLRNFSEWVVDIWLVRVAAVVIMGVAFIPIWLPGPVWRLEVGSAVLLAGLTWYCVRVGGNPNVEHVGLERLIVVLAAIGVLWRDAHVLFGIWP